jgi:hypothetical protein
LIFSSDIFIARRKEEVVKRNKLYQLSLMQAFSLITLVGCALATSPKGPLLIKYSQDTLVLAWDDEQDGIQGSPSTVAYFNIYFRSLGTMDWNYLSSTPDSNASVTIRRIGDGKYEFAVQSVMNNGTKSELHSSAEFSASPAGGWYLQWN